MWPIVNIQNASDQSRCWDYNDVPTCTFLGYLEENVTDVWWEAQFDGTYNVLSVEILPDNCDARWYFVNITISINDQLCTYTPGGDDVGGKWLKLSC